MRSPKATVTKERTIIVYSELWHASSCLLETGRREPRGYQWQFLASAVMTAFCFEAYLNHVGPHVLNDWQNMERLPPLQKFELLCEALKIEFRKGVRPRQTIEELFEFRNTMAHGRTDTLSPDAISRDVNDHLDSYLGVRPLARWEQLNQTDAFAARAREDTKAILTQIQDARPDPKEFLFSFGIGSSGATVR